MMTVTETLTSPVLTLVLQENGAPSLDFAEQMVEIVDELALILENFIDNEDDVSLELFDWGSYAITLLTTEDLEQENLVKLIKKHFSSLEIQLNTTHIQLKASEAHLDVEIRIHEFAKEMFIWLSHAHEKLQGCGICLLSEATQSIQRLSLEEFPSDIAVIFFDNLMNKASRNHQVLRQKIEYQRQVALSIQTTRSVSENLERGRAAFDQALENAERSILQRIHEMSLCQQSEIHSLQLRIERLREQVAEQQLAIRKVQSANAHLLHEVNQLKIEQTHMRNHIHSLQNELNSSGGCIIL